jgi:sialic acid synthase SpsE
MLALAVGASAVLVSPDGRIDADPLDRLRRRIATLRALDEAARRSLLPGYEPDELDLVDAIRPGVVAACAIRAGTVLTADMLALRAPVMGLSAEFLPSIVGRTVRYDLRAFEPITFGVLS